MAKIIATSLQCEFFTCPMGIDTAAPRFSWTPMQEGRDRVQSAYRVQVAESEELLRSGKYFWDSGITASDKCANIVCTAELKSSTRYFWCVTLADGDGVWGPTSEPTWFETALMSADEWQGRYIGFPISRLPQYIRREFSVKKPVEWARAYIAGLGYYELWINGVRQGDRYMEPGFTDYEKRVFYSTYDVASSLKTGENGIGVIVSSNWFRQGCFKLQLNIRYTDGTTDSIVSEPAKWDMLFGPVCFTNIYMGEHRDYRFNIDGWSEVCPDFSARFPRKPFDNRLEWRPGPMNDLSEDAVKGLRYSCKCFEAAAPGGKLQAQPIEPIRICRTIKAKSITSPKEGVYVADFGENVAGWATLNTCAPKDTVITIRHAEVLFEDGTVNQSYLKAAELYGSGVEVQTDVYRVSGAQEVCEPKFTYHGFRFVQIEGSPTRPSPEDITACVVHTDVKQRGFFSCKNDLVNKLQEIILRTETDNIHSIPTDCPQRDERMGWLNDMTVRYEEAIYNFNMLHIYEKWSQDITDAQEPISGAIPDTAPMRRGSRPADPVTVSYLLSSKCLLDHFGDVRTVERQYEGYSKWTNYLYRQTTDGILDYSYWGDWAGPAEFGDQIGYNAVSAITPGSFMSTGYMYYLLKLMNGYALTLGKKDDADDFARRAEEIAAAFNRHYFHPETCVYSTGSQACQSFPLFLGIVPAGKEKNVAKLLADDVINRGYHLTTGNLCSKYVPEQLAEYGYIDVAFKLLTQTTYPSWGFMIENGATTIWERWENATTHGMNSHNHPMYASISAFMYKYLAGITVGNASGFDTVCIKPFIPTDLNGAEARLETVRGTVYSGWEKHGEKLTLTVEVPVSCKAEVVLPSPALLDGVKKSGTVTVGSGKYIFEM